MPLRTSQRHFGGSPGRPTRFALLALVVALTLAVAPACAARKPIPQTGAITPAQLQSLMTSVEGQAAFRQAFVTMYKTSEGRAAFRDVMADLFTAPDTAPVVKTAMVDGLRTVGGQAALVQALGSVEARPTMIAAVSTVISGSTFRSMIQSMVNSAVASMMPKTTTPTAPETGR